MSTLVIIRFVRQNIVRGNLLLIVKSYQSLLITTLIMKLPAKSGDKREKNECKKKETCNIQFRNTSQPTEKNINIVSSMSQTNQYQNYNHSSITKAS